MILLGYKYTNEKISRNLFDCIIEEINSIDTYGTVEEIDKEIERVTDKLTLIVDKDK
jgi:hypothetical protein